MDEALPRVIAAPGTGGRGARPQPRPAKRSAVAWGEESDAADAPVVQLAQPVVVSPALLETLDRQAALDRHAAAGEIASEDDTGRFVRARRAYQALSDESAVSSSPGR